MPPHAMQIGPTWQNGMPTFVQQGQVDWVAFGNTIWSCSAAMLQRFAGWDMQPVTYGAGLALASRFRMSNEGRQRMNQTMQNLRSFPGLQKILWFGFGHQSFVKTMGDSQIGINCMALCSCLTEVHSEETAARVLEVLWELNRFPENYEPSHTQFLALVKACSGVVARSGFGNDLDAMTGHGLWPFGQDRVYNSALKASNASDIARALDALFQITRGEIDTITLLGQNECAFVAAFAHWLFDLTIHIEDETGKVLFKSYEDLGRENAQVVVIYTQEEEPRTLQQQATYVLPIGTDVISRYFSNSESRWIWKVPWDGCLVRTFGPAIRVLSDVPNILGTLLGGTARIYAALATGEVNVGNFSRHRFIEFTQHSYRHVYIHSVTSIFAELGQVPGLYDAMELTMGSTFNSACVKVEEVPESLRNMCPCRVCSNRSSSDLDADPNDTCSGNCLFALAMTIRNLVTVLACTIRDEALLAAVHGLQSYYARNHSSYSSWVEDKDQRTLVAIATGLALITDSDKLLMFESKSESLIHDIRELFDGSLNDSVERGITTTATSSSGICCYRECLRGISTKAAAMRMIHVIPGHIERGAAQYDAVQDGGVDERISSTLATAKLAQADDTNKMHNHINVGNFKVKVLASESSKYRRLQIHYKILLPNGSVAQIQPGRLSNHVLECTGILACHRGKKCKNQLAFPCSAVQSGWHTNKDHAEVKYHAGIGLCLWGNQDDLARCVAFSFPYSNPTYQTALLRQDECLPCCSESVLRESASIINNKHDRRAIVHVI